MCSPGVLVDKTLYISGQIGWDVEGKLAEGIEAQTKLALENMGHVLAVVGANHSNGKIIMFKLQTIKLRVYEGVVALLHVHMKMFSVPYVFCSGKMHRSFARYE